MAQNKKTANQRKSNEDQVLRTAVIAVIVLFIVAALIVGIKSLNPRPDTTEGVKKLKEMEQADIKEIEKEIQTLDTKEANEKEERDSRPNEEKFKNTLIIGDYIAQGLYEQEVLGESFILANEDASVYGMDDTQMITNLEAAAKKKPEVLFFMLGVNDASKEDVNAEIFENNYSVFLDRVKEKLPETKIFVNSILPVQKQAIEETAGLSEILDYNKRLQALCKEKKVIYIDNSDLVKDKYYKEDGKHMNKKFYTLWAKHMADAADL
ncbi:MAG: GDSL-type esterase/lipase family protein [Lachnospiraceae bacterium]